MNLEASAIKSVTFYTASPVTTCDRCGTGIKNVFSVAYRDGERQRYGSECINKILENAPTLKSLFAKNAKLLKKYLGYRVILSGPVEQMPRGSEYFGSGLYFIGDGEGKDISFNSHWFFHPSFDEDKNGNGRNYVVTDAAAFASKQAAAIAKDLPKLEVEIARLEAFLAKILRGVPQK